MLANKIKETIKEFLFYVFMLVILFVSIILALLFLFLDWSEDDVNIG